MTDNLIATLERHFDETGKAHHSAYIQTGGADAEWPLWYADALFGKLQSLLRADFTKSELIYALVLLSKEQPIKAPDVKWPAYYAGYFAEHYAR